MTSNENCNSNLQLDFQKLRTKNLLNYEQFTAIVLREYAALNVSGWYRVGGNFVLPPERKIVELRHSVAKAHKTGYWFIAETNVASLMTFGQWLDCVRWKALNGHGIVPTAWHLTTTDSKNIEVRYGEE